MFCLFQVGGKKKRLQRPRSASFLGKNAGRLESVLITNCWVDAVKRF